MRTKLKLEFFKAMLRSTILVISCKRKQTKKERVVEEEGTENFDSDNHGLSTACNDLKSCLHKFTSCQFAISYGIPFIYAWCMPRLIENFQASNTKVCTNSGGYNVCFIPN